MTSRATVADLMAVLEEVASFKLAETWDNVGLMVGDPAQEVSGILIALDPTDTLLNEAAAVGVNTIITHHPLIFQPLKSVRTDRALGRFLRRALAENISVMGCHTNLDLATGGVNDVLAATLGLTDVQPLAVMAAQSEAAASEKSGQPNGFGRWGRLSAPMTGEIFLHHVQDALDASVVAVAGRLPKTVSTVAVCGGSGSDLAQTAFLRGAQVYVTGEVKLSTARWAEANGFCIIDAGHFATENPVVAALAGTLQKTMAEKGWVLDVLPTRQQQNPFIFYHYQKKQSQPG